MAQRVIENHEPFSAITMEGMGNLIRAIQGAQALLGPRGGLGDWRPELRAYMAEVSGQIRNNFDTHSAAGVPFDPVKPRTARRRTNVAMRGTLEAMIDQGRGIPATAVAAHTLIQEAHGHRTGMHRRDGQWIVDPNHRLAGLSQKSNTRGWRGLRDIASNTTQGAYGGASLYRVGMTSASIGVRAGTDGVPYAAALLYSSHGHAARNYMAMPAWVQQDLLGELVADGVRERLAGNPDYRGSRG